jgi:primary-amine oxidase
VHLLRTHNDEEQRMHHQPDTQNTVRPVAPIGPGDPLANLSADEITYVTSALTAAGRLDESVRVVYLGLREPHKATVYAARGGGEPVVRQARVLLLDTTAGIERDLDVSIGSGEIVSERVVDSSVGRLPVTNEECVKVGEVLAADPAWCAAVSRRGVDPAHLVYAAQTAGDFPELEGNDRRILRALAFRQDHPKDLPWAHPVAGIYATVDMITHEVLAIVDDELLAIPEEPGNYDDPVYVGPAFEGLKPIEITQPEGPSFTLDGQQLTWARWNVTVGFDAREGLVLRDLRYTDAGEERPVAYRASIAEMVVPYGDPTSTRYWQTYFDVGEFLFGRYTNSLRLGCDCLGEIRYLDAVLADEQGRPQVIDNAICIHEEDYGVLWKHEDIFTGSREVRRNRRLVISSFTTVGNYDYGFYWYLYLDGTIECEAKLNGIVFTSAYRDALAPHSTHIAPGLAAPYHQHLFTARIDMVVDGLLNAVDEIEVQRLPVGDGNPHGNAFTKRVTRLDAESEPGRLADASVGRIWAVVSTERTNRMGEATGYALLPEQNPTLLAAGESSIARRNRYLAKQLWVTAYDPTEQYPAGDFANQSTGKDGLSEYANAGRSIEGADIVLWHVFGPTHFPRLEEWPIMPVDYARFTLRPLGFFDRNPVLDIPPTQGPQGHCASEGMSQDEGPGPTAPRQPASGS